jgi:spermidine/putrescine transport system substrate-binding protein
MTHPREGGRKHPFSAIDRREFLKRSGMTAAAIPLASAILAACAPPPQAGVVAEPARPDNPVTLPAHDNLLIADGLKPEEGPLELYNWEEYINPRVVGMFEDQYGVKVNVNTFNTMSEAVANLTTSDGTLMVRRR